MARQWQPVAFNASSDAYVDWLWRGPGSNYPPKFAQQYFKSILVQMAKGRSIEDFVRAIEHAEFKSIRPEFRIPGVYLRQNDRAFLPPAHYFTASVTTAALAALEDHADLKDIVDRIIISQTLPDDAICEPRASCSGPTPTAATQMSANDADVDPKWEVGAVVIGIIDEGIAFANQRFRRSPDDTRVEYAWLQDGRCDHDVEGFHYGRELRKCNHIEDGETVEGIDCLFGKCDFDEEQFYRRAGLSDFARQGHKAAAQRIAHGTHVMDLAGGYDQGTSPRHNGVEAMPIICVQLPTITVGDTSGLGLERYMLDAVRYILDRAGKIQEDRQCKALPVVINFSSGMLAGPHDGTHPIELALDKIIADRYKTAPTEIVLPSGNSHLSRLHAKFPLPAKQAGNAARELPWRVQPDGKTCSYVEVWLPKDATAGSVELMLDPPCGEKSPPLPNVDGALEWRPNDEQGLCRVYYQYFGHPTNRGRYLLALLPTAFEEPPTQLAPSGCWKIWLSNTGNQTIEGLEAWIQWDDRPLGYPRSGRQSYFDDPNYKRFDDISGRELQEDDDKSVVQRAGSINAIATGNETVVVGGFCRKELLVASYSAGGPTARDDVTGQLVRIGPDALAVSEASNVHHGMLAAGTRSRSVVAMNGTSVAAPQIARALASQLITGDRSHGRDRVKQMAADQEHRYPDRPPPPLEPRGGRGRIVTPPNIPSERERYCEIEEDGPHHRVSSRPSYQARLISYLRGMFRKQIRGV